MRKLITLLRARLADERGFTMIVVLGALVVAMGLSVAAYGAANGDLGLGRNNQDQKQAYAAAEAGLNDYFFHLSQNPDYWSLCTTPASYLVQAGASATGHWRPVSPGSSSSYVIELLPAPGHASCDSSTTAAAQASMIDPSSGTFRIRVTGRSRNVTRSLVASFRRRGFLDYLYFTDLEDGDPTIFGGSSSCSNYYRYGRSGCTDIQFAPGDVVAGPFHTNDEMLVCGSPTFGRNAQDSIEASDLGPALPDGVKPPGWRAVSGCANTQPNFLGTFAPGAPELTLPSSNATLRDGTDSQYQFTGQTKVVLGSPDADHMTVTNATRGLNGATMSLPPNGVIYVSNGACGKTYDYKNPYPSSEPQGCADVYVQGTYSGPLTIGSDKDIIVNGNIANTGDGLLGLIANNFVRVYHPVDGDGNPTYPPGTSKVTEIDAAILALQHSFIVDNYAAGAPLGTLTVKGAIAQKFRGPVGTGSGSTVATGYVKNYTYDDRLRYRTPPSFLDPVKTSWRIQRYTEQVPPAY